MAKDNPQPKGLPISRLFTQPEVSPYDMFPYERRSSTIRNPSGDVVAELKDVEVPAAWSQIATDILAQKYLRKAGVPQADGSTGAETSVKQVVHRMANCWTDWGIDYGYFKSEADAQAFYDELVYMLLGQYAAPNSPQWFNTGLYTSYGLKGKAQGHFYLDPDTGTLKQSESAYERPQPHACFILGVQDDLVNKGGIMDLWVQEARIFKYGSGVGSNFSNIRGKDEKLGGGGSSSGLMSFLRIGDRAAGAIKSGGTTRRAAKMVCLDLDHPEIVEFINWKREEEKKVAALIAGGYSSDYDGEAYQTVSGQNSNNSVRVPNAFMDALQQNEDWELKARTDGSVTKSIPARELWQQIADAAWACADPGIQFDTTINEWHTCPAEGPIRASNPCSEYMFLDNTACNLASLNLLKFYDEATQEFDVAAFEHASRLWTIVLEISVLMAQFPSEAVARNSYDYRTIGLGYANLGALLMVQGLPYDSDKARSIAAGITSLMTGVVYRTSAELAQKLGAFPKYALNREAMLRVIRNHRFAAHNTPDLYEGLAIPPVPLNPGSCPDYLLSAACQAWDEALKLGEKHGYRNAQATVIAPTGTIGLLMDCDTTGVEPDFALVKYKKLAGGGYFKIINQSIPRALQKLGYTAAAIEAIVNYAKGHATFKGAPHVNEESLLALGFTAQELAVLEAALPTAYDLVSLFSTYTLGGPCLQRLGFTPAQYSRPDFNLLCALGYTPKQLEEAKDYICGTMTIEGAPYLKEEHYPVFDCANRCGDKGTRFIQAEGHIQMMVAVQPFISGAISKTINLPHETTVEEVARCYELSWALGLKACSLYRDGSKLSQPLSSKSSSAASEEEPAKEETPAETSYSADQVLQAARAILSDASNKAFRQQLTDMVERRKLPDRRGGFTQKAKIDGHTVYIRTGEYADGSLGEIFIDMYKEGASFRSILNCFAISVSLGLQYGVPLEEFVNRFTFTRFEPAGRVEHPNIKSATSVFDYLFRLLGYEYLNRQDLVHVQEEEKEVQQDLVPATAPLQTSSDTPANNPKEYKVVTQSRTLLMEQTQQVLANMMGDAPICNVCGHITIRSGTCYKCLNCGNSLGCS
ncbi:ribonucleoside-diphosphate reductase class II [Pontibacter ummariensis]|uniref:Vitamin B12-dependent ribonucleotide reductase n=1 Tax=Pontibacter ummariensis TaxID=1610492 RepID=A0A239LU46_9BACT|nr:vitamin B12-dependent ribonucleotide reductase [Pontibacter ummariensis]PRY01227.1 ribonucleoside-diphosphate reductase class II [Pontibacter ummariensis]SNT33144.1 ribonucleoside-diphosphate reductase class II [Pontibacter ummariensis]